MADPELPDTPIEAHKSREELASPEDVARFMNKLTTATEETTEAYEKAMKAANEEMMNSMRPSWFPKKAWFNLAYGIMDLITKTRGEE